MRRSCSSKRIGTLSNTQTASAWEKLSRAEEHLAAIGDEFEDFLGKHVFRLKGSYDRNASVYRFVVDTASDPPLHLALVVGDAVHNTYAALDHAVWGLAGGQRTKQTRFPIHSSAESFERGRAWSLAGINDGIQAFIEQLQPYHQRSLFAPLNMSDPPHVPHPLEALRALENVDKHRVIPTVTTVLDSATYKLEANKDVGDHVSALDITFGPLKRGAVFAQTRLSPKGPDPVLNVAGTFALRPGFSLDRDNSGVGYERTLAALEYQDIIETLEGLHNYVTSVIHAIDDSLDYGTDPQLPETVEVQRAFERLTPGRWTARIDSHAHASDSRGEDSFASTTN